MPVSLDIALGDAHRPGQKDVEEAPCAAQVGRVALDGEQHPVSLDGDALEAPPHVAVRELACRRLEPLDEALGFLQLTGDFVGAIAHPGRRANARPQRPVGQVGAGESPHRKQAGGGEPATPQHVLADEAAGGHSETAEPGQCMRRAAAVAAEGFAALASRAHAHGQGRQHEKTEGRPHHGRLQPRAALDHGQQCRQQRKRQ